MKFLHKFSVVLFLSATLLQSDIIMGVVPQQSPISLLKVWQPVAEYLSQATGEKVIFKTQKSIKKFEDVLYAGEYDFAYMNPYHYVIAHKKQNYIAYVRAEKNIKGLILANNNSVKKFTDPNVQYIFPSPNAFAATLLTKYDLVEEYGVSLDVLNRAKYVNSHDSVYINIARGFGDFGGGIERTFNGMSDQKVKSQLKIVHYTKEYPSHPFAFKSTMSKKKREAIVKALLSMPQTILKPLNMKKLKPIDNEEYKSVKDLAIKLQIMD
jgi:phosphonate transport system substrate-binding protein